MTASPSDETDRPVDQIERDLAAKRERLTADLACLIDQVHPKAVVRRALAQAKSTAQAGLADLKIRLERVSSQTEAGRRRIKAELRDEAGWRTDRLVAVAGGLLGVVTFAGVVRRLSGQKR
ncbi:MAG: DUF3618 domain-containing protein [Propionibacteriaceae bacterium]|jgi:hypothetical protein|nr:DUF3618 domain-containing protein [Propionibacteriaceae bacterium]